MKRTGQAGKAGARKSPINTILIVISVILLIIGLILLLIEPIKRYNRRKISTEALKTIERKIQSTDPVEEPQATFIVPATGNEVTGEDFDFIGETEETEEEAGGSGGNVTLTSIGILKIGSINIRYSVWDDANQVSLRYGLGHYADSVMPGETGNATILGHNYRDGSMFHKLGQVKVGDKVVFTDLNGKEWIFYAKESKIISADDLLDYALGNITDSRQLTLVTCTYEYGPKGWRRIVICELSDECIPAEPAEVTESTVSTEETPAEPTPEVTEETVEDVPAVQEETEADVPVEAQEEDSGEE